MPAPSSSSYFSPPCYKKLSPCSWIYILHSTVTTLWTKTGKTACDWSIASLTLEEREKRNRLKFLFGINTTIFFYIVLAKARLVVILEFNREAIIHSSTDKEGKYLPTLLQSPIKVISAWSPLESRVAPSLWNLSQKQFSNPVTKQAQNCVPSWPIPAVLLMLSHSIWVIISRVLVFCETFVTIFLVLCGFKFVLGIESRQRAHKL